MTLASMSFGRLGAHSKRCALQKLPEVPPFWLVGVSVQMPYVDAETCWEIAHK